MLIILEGPDGSGKSTLLSELRYRAYTRHGNDVTCFHSGPPTKTAIEEYLVPLSEHRAADHHVVCDRWHLGEVVYPVIYNRPTTLDPITFWYIEAFLKSRGALLVLMNVPLTESHDRLAMRDGRYLTPAERDEHDQSRNLFLDAYDSSTLTKVTIDRALTTEEELSDTANFILDLAYRVSEQGRYLSPHAPSYTGHPYPEVVLVGDRRHNGPRGKPQVPTAFSPESPSGRFLLEVLQAQGLLEPGSHLGIVNACEGEDLAMLWSQAHHPALVALGRNAAKELERLRLPFTSVYHPQFMRRFQFTRQIEYGRDIAMAAELETIHGQHHHNPHIHREVS